MKRIAILASGGGSNAQAIMDACQNGILKGFAEVVAIVSNNRGVKVLERAQKANVPAEVIENNLSEILNKYKPDLVCLAGYMKLVHKEIVEAYTVINIHPARLPKFGGKGMYGINVHKAVVAAGERVSGATVHFANEHYDDGDIIIQSQVEVLPSDTPESLAKKVLKTEHEIYPKAIKKLIDEGVV
jgi:formyltetrahydrofolate-dependent phosphoribosylglycinamide formyltransferase